MRDKPLEIAERHRVTSGRYGSPSSFGCTGAFLVPCKNAMLKILASDGSGWPFGGTVWEHVSVSLENRCPRWEEMAFVKDLFWRPDETVLEFHVRRDEHISHHDYCLHLWRPLGVEVPMPPRGTLIDT